MPQSPPQIIQASQPTGSPGNQDNPILLAIWTMPPTAALSCSVPGQGPYVALRGGLLPFGTLPVVYLSVGMLCPAIRRMVKSGLEFLVLPLNH